MLDSEIKLINDDRANLELWDRARIYVGTVEVMARLKLIRRIDYKVESGFCSTSFRRKKQLQKNYDKFIIYLFSYGNNRWWCNLDAGPRKHSRFNEILDKLKVRLQRNLEIYP